MTGDFLTAKCFVPMNGIDDIVCEPDSWHISQFSSDKCTVLKRETESSLVASLLPRLQDRSFNPWAYHLYKIDWSVFGTGTYENDYLAYNTDRAEKLRQIDFRYFIACVCAKHRLRIKNLLFYGKTEWGANKRGHYNFLIGRRGTEKVSPEILAASMQELWSTGEHRRGRARQTLPSKPRHYLLFKQIAQPFGAIAIQL